MNKKAINIFIIVLLVLSGIGLIIVYPKLPEIIPTSWNWKGEIQEYNGKNTVWVLYGVLFLLNLLLIVVPKIDPRKDNYKKFKRVYDYFRLMINVFIISIIALMISVNFINNLPTMDRITFALVGILLAFIGNYMPKFKHNYTMGIKTPWTLADERVWNRTHRMAAPIWVVGGILQFFSALFIASSIKIYVFITLIVIMVIVPSVYSYIIFNKLKTNSL